PVGPPASVAGDEAKEAAQKEPIPFLRSTSNERNAREREGEKHGPAEAVAEQLSEISRGVVQATDRREAIWTVAGPKPNLVERPPELLWWIGIAAGQSRVVEQKHQHE